MLPQSGIIEILLDFSVKPVHVKFPLIKFGNNFFTCDQVDKAIKRDMNQVLTNDPGEVGNSENCDQGSTYNGSFQSSCSAGNHCQIGVSNRIVGILRNDL